jgi:hypothetical protein
VARPAAVRRGSQRPTSAQWVGPSGFLPVMDSDWAVDAMAGSGASLAGGGAGASQRAPEEAVAEAERVETTSPRRRSVEWVDDFEMSVDGDEESVEGERTTVGAFSEAAAAAAGTCWAALTVCWAS